MSLVTSAVHVQEKTAHKNSERIVAKLSGDNMKVEWSEGEATNNIP